MNLVKFTIIIAISIFVSSLLLHSVATIYNPPEFDRIKCYGSLDDCSELIKLHCKGESSYFICGSEFMEGPAYNLCIEGVKEKKQDCSNQSIAYRERHQIIRYLILFFTSISLLIAGFFISSNKTISFGIMGAGFIVFINMSVLTGISQSLEGLSMGIVSTSYNTFKNYLILFFHLSSSIILVLFTFLKIKE